MKQGRRKQPNYKKKNTKEILWLIKEGKNNLYSISIHLNSLPSSIHPQLINLEREKYIIKDMIKRYANKKKYYLTKKGLFLLNYFSEMEILQSKYKEVLK